MGNVATYFRQRGRAGALCLGVAMGTGLFLAAGVAPPLQAASVGADAVVLSIRTAQGIGLQHFSAVLDNTGSHTVRDIATDAPRQRRSYAVVVSVTASWTSIGPTCHRGSGQS
jgi:hypothetical protein